MKLAKAIENVHFLSTAGAPKLRLEEIVSLKLLVEAGKRLEWSRLALNGYPDDLLKGETKE